MYATNIWTDIYSLYLQLLHKQTQGYVETEIDFLIKTVKKLANELKNISQFSLNVKNSEGIKKQAEHILEKCTALEKTAK